MEKTPPGKPGGVFCLPNFKRKTQTHDPELISSGFWVRVSSYAFYM
jgi:hypothetical protein